MAGAHRPRQVAAAPMELGGGQRDTGAWLHGTWFSTDIFPFFILMAIFGIGALLLLPSILVGRIAARGGTRRDGDIAMAVFASYVIGQFMPLFY